MADVNRITYIGADAHPANQGIVFADEETISSWHGPNNPLEFYRAGTRSNRCAAFQLMPDRHGDNCPDIPLKVHAVITVDQPGHHRMEAEGRGLTLYSSEFWLESGSQTVEIGPFCASLLVECPFRVAINRWTVVNSSNGRMTFVDDVELDMYFFLGSTTLPLTEFPKQQVHVHELVKRTIPFYEEVKRRDFAHVESKVVARVVYSLWKLGEADFRYDSRAGDTSFFIGGHFQLGRMLKKQARTVNCFDMAALVYAGLKSFGKRPLTSVGGQETDVFDIGIHRIEEWGYIHPGTLFGFGGTANNLANNPFWQCQPGNQISMVDPMDRSREPFSQHCFTLMRTSAGQERVVDVCLATPDTSPEATYSDCQHLFQDGWCDLDRYKAHTDRGWRQMTQGDLLNVPIPWISISLSPEDRKCRAIYKRLNNMAMIKHVHHRDAAVYAPAEFPHWCFRPSDAQGVKELINELRQNHRIPYFGSQP